MKQVDEGIFLFRTAFSETSLIITFYTKSSGLKKFIFKGGKKKAHNLFPMSVSELTFYERKEIELSILVEASAQTNTSFQFDPIKSAIAFFIAEVTRKCLDNHERDVEMYVFLTDAINRLEKGSDLSYFPVDFMVGFTRVLGIHPMQEGNNAVFNFEDGTIGGLKGNRGADGAQVHLLLDRMNGREGVYSKEEKTKALNTMINYYAYHISRMDQLDTLEIVKEVLN
jgi:DNA repair protein RecO (recombination protein O)